MQVTAFGIAQRFIGVREIPGAKSNPQVLAMLRLDDKWPLDDEVAWCSAFVNYICWLLRLPRSKSLLARSWLGVGEAIDLTEASVGFDVVVLKRNDLSPGPEDMTAPGHVGFFAGLESPYVAVLGGNQADTVSVALFDVSRVIGVRRLID